MKTSTMQFITDDNGRKISVVLPVKDYHKMQEELEELEDIRLYDKAKKHHTGERILLADYLKGRKRKK